MELSEISAVEEVLRTQLGASARLRLYDPELNSPMNFVLKRAEKHLSSRLSVYWVEDALPEVFCLRGFSEPVIVFSTRYVELWGDVRAVLTSNIFGPELKPRIAKHLSLRLIAELSLSKNDPEFTACAILQSTMASEGLFQLPNTLMSMEHEPIGVPYMACWFYGLAHEIGHFISLEREDIRTSIFPDDVIQSAIKMALDDFALPSELREEALASAQSNRSGFILGLDTVRSEGYADIFATSLLFESTAEIMRAIEEDPGEHGEVRHFELGSFITEMVISLNVVALIDRCRRTAIHACTAAPLHQHGVEAVLHPVAVYVRLLMVRYYLQSASSVYLFGDDPTPEQEMKVSAMIDAAMKGLRPAIETVERGLAEAMSFSLDRSRRPFFFQMLDTWKQKMTSPGLAASERIAIEQFCRLAASLGKCSPVFDTMLSTMRDPSAPLDVKFDENRCYLCPWVVGPNDFSRPFGLDTRHGHIIFIFLDDGELFKAYHDRSAELLADGYKMQSAMLIVQSEQQLRDTVALRLPLDQQFQIVLEGTEVFDQYMKELIEGTIWSE